MMRILAIGGKPGRRLFSARPWFAMEGYAMDGLFGSLFDINGDGELNAGERMLDFALFHHMAIDGDEAAEKLSEAGIDPRVLELMDDDERLDALEDAGLDPDDLDF